MTLDVRRRTTWRNHTGNQSCQPLGVGSPASLDDILEVVATARREHVTVRAVGSGHSWSDVALTGGFLLRPDRLAGPLPLDPAGLRHPRPERLRRFQGGTRIRELNEHLWADGLALPNMGGYDGQTIAGVVSTSTHGSGLRFGPLCDLVRSLDLVTGTGRRVRLEPRDGPTAPTPGGRTSDGWELVHDDDLFAAALVGMGCMGVAYAVTLEVRDRFALTESRTLTTWEEVRGDLLDGAPALRDRDHWELLLSPYAPDGVHRCVVTSRVPAEPGYEPEGADRRRPWVTELLAQLPITHGVMDLVLDFDPDGTPEAMDQALEGIADREYTDRSYRVFNIGAANLMPAYSSEIGIALEGDLPVRAVERVFEVAERYARVGDIYATAPFSLRFVKASPALLSMMHGRDTMMIELIMQTDTEGGFELLAAYERALHELGGRPHWGQVNDLTERALGELYPALPTWRAARRELDPDGVFDAPFTTRTGLS
ncbi:MAG TPA: D-arabinono-1,4-lactone oxidase [Solirubrobacteraceae bacterium]|nr:D-arabinono-1,4-lactone oxidase [Solirubrobacteraceae bacterium]